MSFMDRNIGGEQIGIDEKEDGEKENQFYPPKNEDNEKPKGESELTENTIPKKTTTGLITTEKDNALVNEKALPYPELDEIPELKIKDEDYFKSEVKISDYKSVVKISDYFKNINKFDDKKYNLCNNCHVNNNVYFCQRCKKNLCKECRESIEICNHFPIDIIDLRKQSNDIEEAKKSIHKIILNVFLKPKKSEEKLPKTYNINDSDMDKYKNEINNSIDNYKKQNDIELIDRIIGANYINYYHYVNILECKNYLENRYDKCFNKCCLKINYLNRNGQKIKIFGDDFVKNNIDKFFLIINNNQTTLIPAIKIEDKYLEVILVQKSEDKIITNLSCMFQNCVYLNNIEEYKDHTSIDFNDVEDINFMFNNCTRLKELNLNLFGSFENEKLKSMKSTFLKCTLLKKISGIDKWKTKNVEIMASMFSECVELSNIEGIEKFDTQNVEDFSEMFFKCETLNSIPDISIWNMGKAKTLKGMFKKCKNIEKLPDISKWELKNVTTMEEMFYKCSKLKTLPDISQWYMSNVENICRMFKGCRNVTNFPDISRWNNLRETVKKEGIFDDCPNNNN